MARGPESPVSKAVHVRSLRPGWRAPWAVPVSALGQEWEGELWSLLAPDSGYYNSWVKQPACPAADLPVHFLATPFLARLSGRCPSEWGKDFSICDS